MTAQEKRVISSIYEAIRKNPETLEEQLARLEKLAIQSRPFPQSKLPPLDKDWDIVVNALFDIAKRADRLRGNLHKVFLPGEPELVLDGLVQPVRNFLNHIMEFVPESEIAKAEGSNIIDASSIWMQRKGEE